MTTKSKDPREQLSSVAQLLVQDLLNTPDEELLKEAGEDTSLIIAGTKAKESYQKAIQSIGAKRLEIARAQMAEEKTKSEAKIVSINAARAHRIIAKLAANNDSNLTLAARKLDNISDNEAIELVKELMELGALKLSLIHI